MTEESEDRNDFAELSDEEIRELSEEFTDVAPEAMGKALGIDIVGEFEEDERQEFEKEFPEQIEELLLGTRDALAKESEEERAVAMFDVYTEMLEQILMGAEEREAFESGFEFLVEQLHAVLEESREEMVHLGYAKYFDIVDEFAVEIVKAGQAEDVKEFFDSLHDDSQQMVLQRVMDPVLTEYYEYIDEHPAITDAREAREYTEMYYELAELVGNVLPQFIAVLQIVSEREETYNDLTQMGLNDLLQKLESKKYERFNELANGIDRELRNSIGHRDFKVDPIEEEIEFHDRGEVVAELTYSEFQDEVFRLLALFNALWVFRLLLTYYRIQQLPEAVDELRTEEEDTG